jgi:hypothetical protein
LIDYFAFSASLVKADLVLVAWYAALPAAFISPELLSGSMEEVTLLWMSLSAAALIRRPELYRVLAMLSTCGYSCMFENADINDCI